MTGQVRWIVGVTVLRDGGLRRSEERAEALSERMRRHVPIPLLRAATSPHVFSTGSKSRN